LGACQVLGGTYFCPNSNILDKRVETNCVLGLYNRNKEVITANCPWISIAATDFTVQLGANEFLLYHSNSKEVQLVCGKESVTRSFHGLKQLHVPAGCQLFTESYIMEGQQNFSLSVDTYIERHVNVEELFNFSRLHVNNMAGILKDLNLVGSTTGLTIKNIKDQYNDYSIEGTFVWVTRTVVICLSIIGLGGIFLCLLRRYKKAKKDHQPLLKRLRNLFTTDNLGLRDQEMQERGGLEEDSDKEDAVHMIPDNMQRGPIGRAPVHISAAAQCARVELHEEARDTLNWDVRDFQETVRDHQALVHRDQQASGGALGGASCL
jgi:hypothetical protein